MSICFSISPLPHLKMLDLSWNKFPAGLPSIINQLTTLHELNLSQCRLTDLPFGLSLLNQLKILDLSRNFFTAGLPQVVSELTSLEKLELRECRLTSITSK